MTLEHAFDILGIKPTYNKKTVKKAYLSQALIYHPDKQRNKKDTEKPELTIYDVNEAYNFVLASIASSNDASLVNEAKYSMEYESLDSAYKNNNYKDVNEGIIDSLFSNSPQDISVEKVYITELEAKNGVTKQVIDSDTQEIVELKVPKGIFNGQILIYKSISYEVIIENNNY